ncbi:hypothetical protein C0991_012605, partial [Blastosporella zonata]
MATISTRRKELNHAKRGIPDDPIVSRLAELDETLWYKKPNLRLLYILMFPTCLGVEMTSG